MQEELAAGDDGSGGDGSGLPSTQPLPDAPPTIPATPTRMPGREEPVLLPGARIGDSYRVVGLLGEGGMGSVYLAQDEALDREVAIKVVRRTLVEQPGVLERFRAEARAMARLSRATRTSSASTR